MGAAAAAGSGGTERIRLEGPALAGSFPSLGCWRNTKWGCSEHLCPPGKCRAGGGPAEGAGSPGEAEEALRGLAVLSQPRGAPGGAGFCDPVRGELFAWGEPSGFLWGACRVSNARLCYVLLAVGWGETRPALSFPVAPLHAYLSVSQWPPCCCLSSLDRLRKGCVSSCQVLRRPSLLGQICLHWGNL